MAMAGDRIEIWMMDEVKKYIEGEFLESTVDYFPRGNASAVLFTGAKIDHLVRLPQGDPERERRVTRMVDRMEHEGFGACSNEGECQAVCPKSISVRVIQRLNREYARATLKGY